MVFSDFSALYVIMFFGELALYSLMGIFATIIFRGTWITFDKVFESCYAKHRGAVIGLTFGYISKCFIDKRYIFIQRQEVIL